MNWKFIIKAFTISILYSALLISCAGEVTELRWERAGGFAGSGSGGSDISDIRWVDFNSDVDTSWSEVLATDGERTDFKPVGTNIGQGFADVGGDEFQLEVNGEISFTLSDGSSNTLVVDDAN